MSKRFQGSINKEQLMKFVWPVGFFVALILVVIFMIMPQVNKLIGLNSQIQAKESILAYVEKSGADLDRLNEEIANLSQKLDEYDKKMPIAEQAIVLIDALKNITAQSALRFSSIEPQAPEHSVLEGSQDAYVQLPIRVRMECGYYDLIDFLSKLETAGRLMKVTDIKIRGIPERNWEHDVTLLITTFAKVNKATSSSK